MASQADINQYSVQIYNQARKGSPVNPGLPVTLANLLVAQARHETGNFTSNAFVQYRNCFGYSYVKGGRYQNGAGLIADNGLPVASYATIADSVDEMIDWIYRRRSSGVFPVDLATVQTPAQYATLLKSGGYYGDTLSNYLTGLTNFFKIISPGSGSLTTVLLFAAAGALYYYRRQVFHGVI